MYRIEYYDKDTGELLRFERTDTPLWHACVLEVGFKDGMRVVQRRIR